MVFLSHSDLLYLFQLNSSVGFNIVSAVFSLVGITLFIVELIINTPYIYPVYDPHFPTWGKVSIPPDHCPPRFHLSSV